MTTDQATRWHQALPESKAWFAMSATHVIAQITERDDGTFQMAIEGTNGLGVGLIAADLTLDDVIREAEGHLQDLGWRKTDEGFINGD